jgi:hypothetical protein
VKFKTLVTPIGFPRPRPRLGVGAVDWKKQNGEDENARTRCHDVAVPPQLVT